MRLRKHSFAVSPEAMWRHLRESDFRPGSVGFYLAAIVAFVGIYGVVLALTSYRGFGIWVLNTLANLLPLLIVAVPARLVIARYVLDLRPLAQTLAHAFGALVFAAVWFFLLMVFLGMASGDAPMTFSVRPFIGPAAIWQMLQGATFYALVALLAYVERLRGLHEPPAATTGDAPANGQRIFVKDGDEMRPLDPERVVHIAAAGDYAQVATRSGTHLLRTSLSDLEDSLGKNFLRVHRSHIVNINHVERVEPAGGGRLTVHLSNGSNVIASRTGAKAIRERAI